MTIKILKTKDCFIHLYPDGTKEFVYLEPILTRVTSNGNKLYSHTSKYSIYETIRLACEIDNLDTIKEVIKITLTKNLPKVLNEILAHSAKYNKLHIIKYVISQYPDAPLFNALLYSVFKHDNFGITHFLIEQGAINNQDDKKSALRNITKRHMWNSNSEVKKLIETIKAIKFPRKKKNG